MADKEHECTNCVCAQESKAPEGNPQGGNGGDTKGNDQGQGGGDKKPDLGEAYNELEAAKQAARDAEKKYEDSGGADSTDHNKAQDDLKKAEQKMVEAADGGGFSITQYTPTFDLLDKEDLKSPDPDLQTIEDLKEAMIDRIMINRANEQGRIDSRKLTLALTRPDAIRKTDQLDEIMPQRWIIFGDCSGSMGHGEHQGHKSNGLLAGECLGLVANAAQEINDQAAEDLIKTHIVAFDGYSYVLKNEAEFDVDSSEVSEHFARKVRRGGSTCLESALSSELDPLEQAIDRRDLVIIFTDGDIGSTDMITQRMEDGRLWVIIGIGGGGDYTCWKHRDNSSLSCTMCEEGRQMDDVFKYRIMDANTLEDVIVRAVKESVGLEA